MNASVVILPAIEVKTDDVRAVDFLFMWKKRSEEAKSLKRGVVADVETSTSNSPKRRHLE